jgi:hypothetical protein
VISKEGVGLGSSKHPLELSTLLHVLTLAFFTVQNAHSHVEYLDFFFPDDLVTSIGRLCAVSAIDEIRSLILSVGL